MKINKYLFLIVFFISCKTEIEKDQDTPIIEVPVVTEPEIIHFSTSIRHDKSEWDLNKTYTDTLIFIDFESDYDYWFGIFKTPNNEYEELIYTDLIDSDISGSTFEVKWKIDSCFEAGEGDELYYCERLITYKILNKVNQFDEFLPEFTKAYVERDIEKIKPYINEHFGMMSTYNPGVYCLLKEKKQPEFIEYFNGEYVISSNYPEGDICDEFEGVQNGFYSKKIEAYEDLPEYTYVNEDGDFIFKRPPLPENYFKFEFRKVLLIYEEENIASFYFIRVESKWYLWIEHKCDCSA